MTILPGPYLKLTTFCALLCSSAAALLFVVKKRKIQFPAKAMPEADLAVSDNQRKNLKRKRERGKRRLRDRNGSSSSSSHESGNGDTSKFAADKLDSKANTASTFLDKMKARLSGGHFRMINEKLYTCTGDEALSYFQEDPALFNVYHSGYQEQMSHWPEQPVNTMIKWLKNHSPALTVADFGCGDAHIAKSVKNKVYSLDLVSKDPSVIACDMSKTPLASTSIDVAIFCLSLMGINYANYIQEAYRVLKPDGWLLIAEVKSRFDPGNGGADPVKFSDAVSDLGFTCVSKDMSNKMFIVFQFRRKKEEKEKKKKKKEIEWPELKACIYKRR